MINDLLLRLHLLIKVQKPDLAPLLSATGWTTGARCKDLNPRRDFFNRTLLCPQIIWMLTRWDTKWPPQKKKIANGKVDNESIPCRKTGNFSTEWAEKRCTWAKPRYTGTLFWCNIDRKKKRSVWVEICAALYLFFQILNPTGSSKVMKMRIIFNFLFKKK